MIFSARNMRQGVAALAFFGLAPLPAQAQSAPDFASICPRIAALENDGLIDGIAVPFGEVDIDNDGTRELIAETIQGSAGAHSIEVTRPAKAAFTMTCDGCGDVFTNRVRAVSIDGRQYVIEYSSGLLARLWEMSPDGTGHARCWFQQTHVPRIEAAAEQELCEAVLHGNVERIAMTRWPRKRQEPVAAIPEFGIHPINTRRVSDAIRIDLDNDGIEEDLVQLEMTGVSCRIKWAIAISDQAGQPEISPRNQALLRAQSDDCHGPVHTVLRFQDKAYIEGRISRDGAPPDSAPTPPFWRILELKQGVVGEVCRFGFDSTTNAVVAD